MVKVTPIVVVLAYAWATSATISQGIDGYGLTASMRAISVLPFVAPICAACAAWEVGRLRRGMVYDMTGSRSNMTITVRRMIPVAAVGMIAMAESAVLVWQHMAPEGTGPSPAVFAMGLLVLAGHIAFGVILGRSMPPVVATPSSFALSYAWLVYPPALTTPWVRHLTGFNDSCCLNSDQLTLGAIVGPSILALSLVVAAALVVSLRRRVLALGISAVLVAGIFVVAASLVSNLGFDPVQPRTGVMVCAGTSPRVCVWPEHSSRLAEASADAARMASIMENSELRAPALATESTAPRHGPEWTFSTSDLSTAAQLRTETAVGLVPNGPPPGCAQFTTWPGADALSALQVWLVAKAGLGMNAASSWATTPVVITTVRAELGKPIDDQASWFRTNLRVATTCGVPPGSGQQ